MSPRSARRVLWLATLLMLPVPMLLWDAFVPVARYLLLAGVTFGLIAAEGWGQVPGLMLAFMLGHALVYAALLWVAAWLLTRLLVAVAPRALLPVTLGLVGLGLATTLAVDVYRTPFAPLHARGNLLGVLR